MRKIIFTLFILLNTLSIGRSYAPYSFQLVSPSSNPILNDDFGLIWKFAKGYVHDSEKKKEDEFFRILIKDIYDSLLFEVKTKNTHAIVPKTCFQNLEHNLIIAELYIEDEKQTDVGLTIELDMIPTTSIAVLDSINVQLDHGMYLNAIPRILRLGDSSTNEFLTKYKSMNSEWNQIRVPFKWKLQNENGQIKFIEKPTINNVWKLEKTVNKYFKGRQKDRKSWTLKLTIEHCFVTNTQSDFPELDNLIDDIASDIRLTCTNSEIDTFNVHFFLDKNRKKYGAIN